MEIFFYGLFMDDTLLAAKGIKCGQVRAASVDGYRLCIGERATLLPSTEDRAYGVVMSISDADAERLYARPSVADYRPESITARLLDGPEVIATCYNLPQDKLSGANPTYAESLLELATRLGFPDTYLQVIREAGTHRG